MRISGTGPILILLTVFGFAGGCGVLEQKAPTVAAAKEVQTIEGQLTTVESRSWPRVAKVQGSFFADETTTIAAKVPGRIIEVNCDLGDPVEKDQVLIKIDPREYELLVAQAESQLTQARSAIGMKPGDLIENLNPQNAPPVREAKAVLDEARQTVKRVQSLFAQNAVVATDLEAALSAESVADARYNSSLNSVREKIALVGVQTANRALAEQRLIDTSIKAPFKGMVQNRTVSIGSYINVGQPMLELVGIHTLRYRAAVPERFVNDLKIGQKVILLLPGEQRREVRVTRISPALDPISRSLMFEAEVPNEDGQLRSGTFAQADIVLEEDSRALAIPSSALVRFAGVQKVWKVADGKVKEAVVEMGREQNKMIEILSGLASGDQIILDGRLGGVGNYKADNVASTTQESPDPKVQTTSVESNSKERADQTAKSASSNTATPSSTGLGQ